MRNKVYKLRIDYDAAAVNQISEQKVDKLIEFACDLDIPMDEDHYDFTSIHDYDTEMHLLDKYLEMIDAAILATLKTKGFVIVDGEKIDDEDTLDLFSYRIDKQWNAEKTMITHSYLMVDDPDVAMLLKLQMQ
ncbi:hypothetical protein QM996_02410 [Sinorhizobium chiapasense]